MYVCMHACIMYVPKILGRTRPVGPTWPAYDQPKHGFEN